MIFYNELLNFYDRNRWRIVCQFWDGRWPVFYVMYHDIKWLDIILSFFFLLYRKDDSTSNHSGVLLNT